MSALDAPSHHPDYRHVALFHDGPDELAATLAPELGEALDRGDAVLVCTNEQVWGRLAGSLGRRADAVQYLPDAVRYERPTVAMKMVHDVLRREVARGAPTVWSVGAIPFDGERDSGWVRYEAAVDAVLSGLPLRAVCTYDTRLLDTSLLDAAARTHEHLVDGDGWRTSTHYAGALGLPIPVVDVPTGPAIVDADVESPAAARRLVLGVQHRLGRHELDDLLLAVSELVTNAHCHGGPPVALRMWIGDERIVAEVTDGGTGIDDPFFELRPPQLRDGGAGLWIVGQLSDALVSTRTSAGAHAMVLERRRTHG
jgi:anti-sigma regulatory factor (Ser/Thr protein kinase)